MNPREAILLVDDEEIVRSSLEAILKREGYEVLAVDSGKKAIAALRERKFSLVLADLVMEDVDGLTILEEVKRESPDTIMIMITGHASVNSALSAMRLGAYDYLIKPCNLNELILTVNKGLEKRRLQLELRARTEALKRANEALSRKVEQMAVIHRLTTELLKPLKLGELLSLIIRGIQDGLGFRRIFVGLIDEEKVQIKGRTAVGTLGEPERTETLSLKEVAQLIEEGERVERCYRPSPGRKGLSGLSENGLLVPLTFDEEGMIGAILVDQPWEEKPPGEEIVKILETFANTTVVAIKRLKLQQQLVDAERLEAITETAISVNHEINNPLTSILLSAQILLAREGLDANTIEKLRIIEQNSMRIKNITEKLAQMVQPKSVPYVESIKMIDIRGSL